MNGPYVCGDSLDLNGYNILAGSYNISNQMQIWDTRTLKVINNIDWDEDNVSFNSNIYCAKFSTKKNKFGIGSSNMNYVRIYDLDNNQNKPILTSKILDKPVYAIDFSKNGRKFVFAGADENISIIDL